jgi:hypothetical protein
MTLRFICNLALIGGAIAGWAPIGWSQGPDQNLIRNPDFSQLDGEVPRFWQRSTWSGQADFGVDFAAGHAETPAVRIASNDGADASWSYRVQVRPHTDYRLSVWAKTDNVELSGGLGVQLNLHELQFEGKSSPISGTNEWTQITTEFNSGRHESLLVNLLFGGWGRATGTAWFDDVTLTEIGSSLPTMTQAEAGAFFDQKIRPILERRCFECHGNESAELAGELALTSQESLLKGGESGPVVDLQVPADSLIIDAINYETFEMPPDGKLPKEEIELLTAWVQLGAPWGTEIEVAHAAGNAAPPKPKKPDPEVNAETKKWWSFQPVVRPEPPAVKNDAWIENDIDRFILSRLQSAGYQPARPAGRPALIRRAYYDLIGLPPTPAEVAQFVADTDPRAYDSLIDRLLASPHYGERWGRHWLDLVRYAESNSFERDGTKPFVWRYRDWVIRSLNSDMPYDRFLLEQLAGDELPDANLDTIIATGYYRLGAWDDEPADPQLAKYDDLDDILATTSQTMLGLTVNCARCHNHKIDPIPQRDYYRLLAFFNNIRRYGIRTEETVLDASVRKIGTPVDSQAQSAYEARIADLRAKIQALEDRVTPDFIPVEHQEFIYPRNRIPLVQARVGRRLTAGEFERYRTHVQQLADLQSNPPPGETQVLCVKESGSQQPATHVLIRGNPHVLGDEVAPGFLSVLTPPDPEIVAPASHESWGGRLALARWITRPDHPLTARVMANRIWQYHFGRGIVRTASDFGFQGLPPTHPELLDWLASEFVARSWSLKSMHKLIMTSAAYQMSTEFNENAYASDPANDLFWRFDMRRLSAEELRDSMLAVSGSLNLDAMYGPSFFSDLAPEVLAGQSRPGDGWGNSSEADRARRAVYIHVKRSLKDPLLANFDAADTDFTCPVRFVTTQPTQALGLFNGRFPDQQAARFAAKACYQADDAAGQVAYILARVLQRDPSAEEITRGVELLADLAQRENLPAEQALKYFCLVGFNLNEFVYLD